MSKIYNKYIKNEDHTWYDSSNIIYSVCFDATESKSLKIVFKAGRTYLYKDVSPVDYIRFRDAESNGKVFNEVIKQYPCTKLDDTNLESLEKMKQDFEKSDTMTEYRVHVAFNNETGEFKLYVNDDCVYEGIEGNVSIINLLRSMKLEFSLSETDEHNQTVEDFDKKPVVIHGKNGSFMVK